MRASASKFAVRKLSTEVAKESPRETVARNLLLYRAIRDAKSVEELQAIAKGPLPKLDAAAVENLGLQGYLTRSFSSSSSKFAKDATAWQNLSLSESISAESARTDTWPFVFGFVFTLGMSVLAMGSFSKEGEKKSRYMQLMEKRGSHDDHHAHH
eukprot:gene7684-9842_t